MPLVVAGPGFAGKGVNAHRVDLRSILPTARRAVGAALPAGVSGGALQDDPDEEVVYAEGVMDMVSARNGAARLVVNDAKLAAGAPDLATRSLGDGRTALYPKPSPENLLGETPDADAEALRASLVGWRATLMPTETTGAPVPAALRSALRDRGYGTLGESVIASSTAFSPATRPPSTTAVSEPVKP